MCKGLYSPKIREDLIPAIHKLALKEKKPMTPFVNEILQQAIKDRQKKEGGAVWTD